jgi:hypothetical protein
MGHAYTPGLTVSAATVVHRRRILPLHGQVVVKEGDRVEADTVVARTDLPGKVHSRNVAADLGLPPSDLKPTLQKTVGSAVKKGDIVAEHKSFFGVFKAQSLAPIDGTLESVSAVTGQAIYREAPVPVEVTAYVRGAVREVIPSEGVVVEARGALVQGIFGVGGESHGAVTVAVPGPDVVFEPSLVRAEHRGKIVIGGKIASLAAIHEAAKAKIHALVVGGLNDDDLRALLGYDLGVAITGQEAIGLTLIVTEGFGPVEMARRTFELLGGFEGRDASVNGATQIRAGVIRPEIIIPHDAVAETHGRGEGGLMQVGSLLRVIREPHFGLIGTVAGLPAELVQIETEAKVRVVEVQLRDGRRIVLPRANVELIED